MIVIVACQLKITASAPVELNDSRPTPPERYLRTNQFANRTIQCTPEERDCFTRSMVRYPEDGSCYPVRSRGPCVDGRWLVVDKREALRSDGLGHVVGKCELNGTRACPPLRIPMARDGICALRHVVCRGAPIAFDIFGEAECVGEGDDGDAQLPVALPSGSCGTPLHEDLKDDLHIISVQTKRNCVRDSRNNCAKEAVMSKINFEDFFY